MTSEERDKIDLEYLENTQEADVDMSPEAVTARMIAYSELCELSRQIKVPHIQPFKFEYPQTWEHNN